MSRIKILTNNRNEKITVIKPKTEHNDRIKSIINPKLE